LNRAIAHHEAKGRAKSEEASGAATPKPLGSRLSVVGFSLSAVQLSATPVALAAVVGTSSWAQARSLALCRPQ